MDPLITAPIIGGIVSAVGKILDRIIPDPAVKDEMKLKFAELVQKGELAELNLVAEQIKVNMEEAKHASVFVAGWRPFIGWTCGSGLAYQFVFRPLLAWFSLVVGIPVPPTLDSPTLLAIVVPLLGFGAYRTYERIEGVHRDQIKPGQLRGITDGR